MRHIEVTIDALIDFGMNCRHLSGELRGAGPAPSGGASFQPTSSAVSNAHAAADRAENLVAERLHWMGDKIDTLARALATAEAHSASSIVDLRDVTSG